MWAEQKKRFLWPFIIAVLQIMMHWVSCTSRLFPHEVQSPASFKPDWESKEGLLNNGKKMELGLSEEEFKGAGSLGSRPPNCGNKCGGCNPCEATQVPTTTDHLGIQYSNYEPEGWKCKCGSSFYNP